MSSRRQGNIPLGGRYRQVSLYHLRRSNDVVAQINTLLKCISKFINFLGQLTCISFKAILTWRLCNRNAKDAHRSILLRRIWNDGIDTNIPDKDHNHKVQSKQQLGCSLEKCILSYAIIYVLIHYITFWLYLYFLNILYFFKYSCTNIFHWRSLYTFYNWNIISLGFNDIRCICKYFRAGDMEKHIFEMSPCLIGRDISHQDKSSKSYCQGYRQT